MRTEGTKIIVNAAGRDSMVDLGKIPNGDKLSDRDLEIAAKFALDGGLNGDGFQVFVKMESRDPLSASVHVRAMNTLPPKDWWLGPPIPDDPLPLPTET